MIRIVAGRAGSGKTPLVMDGFRAALRKGDASARLVAPTATMAQHARNQLAREGVLLRRTQVQTLSEFIEPFAGGMRQVSEPALFLIVEQAAQRVNRPEFAAVAGLPGFSASLARTISEFASAGCDAARLAEVLPETPYGKAFFAAYREVEIELERRGLAMRAQRLKAAAATIERNGVSGVSAIWMDGFHVLPDPELKLIEAMGRHAPVTIALRPDAAAGVGARLGIRALPDADRQPAPEASVEFFAARTVEREASEIARRIIREAEAGRPFREMAVVVRAEQAYIPVLRSAFERFGVPAHFYFDSELHRHPAVRFLVGTVEAMLSGWEHGQTLAALKLAPRWTASAVMDRLDFRVREQLPNSGMGALKALLVGDDGRPRSSEAERLLHKLERMAAIEEWRVFTLEAEDWAARLRDLRGLFRPARPAESAARERVLEWQAQSAALDAFEEALDEAAEATGNGRAIPLEDFWKVVKAVLRLKPLRVNDHRRNVVHVLSAPEARQWEIPVVFVCGLTEKQFPQFRAQEPYFSDRARTELNAAGIRVRTSAELEGDERALFECAVGAATERVTLSYPETDSRGEENLPSIFLAEKKYRQARENWEKAGTPPIIRPRACAVPEPGSPRDQITAPALLRYLREKTERVSPTGLESFLRCPYQYFIQKTLRLMEPPLRPEDRLDPLTQGSIVHEVLAAWYADPAQDIEALFHSMFEAVAEEKSIPESYHTHRLRNAMREDLLAFTSDDRWPREQFQSRFELAFEFPLTTDVLVRGKIDRLDVDESGQSYVIDYKYSSAANAKQRQADEDLLQAPLYVMAAEKAFGVKPAGMFYVGLRKKPAYAGWSESDVGRISGAAIPPDWVAQAAQRSIDAVKEIRAGRVEPAGTKHDKCARCPYRDSCRVLPAGTLAAVEGA